MKTLLVAAFVTTAVLSIGATGASAYEWKSYAVNDDGDRGFGVGDSEDEARLNARMSCQRQMSRTCPDDVNHVIAIAPSWDFAIINCNGNYVVAGSANRYAGALRKAYEKAGMRIGSCREVPVMVARGN